MGLPHPDATFSIPALSIVAESRTITGSYMGSTRPEIDIPGMADLWRPGNLPVERLISAYRPLGELNEAFDALANGSALRQIILPTPIKRFPGSRITCRQAAQRLDEATNLARLDEDVDDRRHGPGRISAMAVTPKPRSRALLFVVLGALSAFGPLSMDLYLPGMPGLARGLETTDSLAQFTISACMIGLAVGQLASGPLSDRIGRRKPLIAGVAIFVIASIVCALSPSISVLLIARFVQGFAGAAGIVVSRTIVRDLYGEVDAARVFSRLIVITGVAPVAAPILGGVLLLFTDWRGMFIALACIGAVLLVGAIFVIPDSLADENRHVGGFKMQAQQIGRITQDRRFMGYALAAGIGGCALFVYISMSSLVFQLQYGVSAQLFSLIFAANSIGIVIASQINAVLVKKFKVRRILLGALLISAAASVAIAISAWVGLALAVLLVPLFVSVSTQGLQGPNTTALALGPYAKGAGAAAAVLGTFQFLIGAIVPPLASLGGTNGAVMGIAMFISSIVAFAVVVILTRARRPRPRSSTSVRTQDPNQPTTP
jgi:DHA1 family bicyclomycin/chloramphenicol resistance-like MFS transporter